MDYNEHEGFIFKNRQNKCRNRQYGIFGAQNHQNDDKSSNLAAIMRIQSAYNAL